MAVIAPFIIQRKQSFYKSSASAAVTAPLPCQLHPLLPYSIPFPEKVELNRVLRKWFSPIVFVLSIVENDRIIQRSKNALPTESAFSFSGAL
ncbi:hypothetical protein [Enterobacter ludwigii]|uniref:hypothetical protein n=1 Tax=Enterobacter ludwigii TaxID=299767 RepID=UPI00307618DB